VKKLLAVVLIGGLFAIGCGGGTTTPPKTTGKGPGTTGGPKAPETKDAPKVEMKDAPKANGDAKPSEETKGEEKKAEEKKP
jgi:hypothetical protein